MFFRNSELSSPSTSSRTAVRLYTKLYYKIAATILHPNLTLRHTDVCLENNKL